ALERGAGAVVVQGWVEDDARPPLTIVESASPRRLMGLVASRFFHAPSKRLDLIAVTGTSGKTTSCYLLNSIFEAAGYSSGIIGTIGSFAGSRKLYTGLTTPESLDFEATLATMEEAGVRVVAAEISSIGLEERRVDQLSFRACVFTNFGRDHLDYHVTLEKYFAAKLRLFIELLPRSAHPEPVAIIRGDDLYGARVLEAVRGRKLSFGMAPTLDVHPASFEIGLNGISATIVAPGRRFEIHSRLLGEINLLNILGASAVSVALGIESDAVVAGVRRCSGAPGRLEAVAAPPGVRVLVDYAHKPDALSAVLDTLRGLRPRRLICVFGCGGDRDRGKRPIMGKIAGTLADVAVLTSDNPRTEPPLTIIAEVEAGLAVSTLPKVDEHMARISAGYVVEPDRRAAIALALRIAGPGDIVLIAGKGHEDYQLVGSQRLNFDDRVVVQELLGGTKETLPI
ncbi:MAG: UDP-N-acetylmuramoyl-L-alanyl-D-glutamate--2,6-diaminopimelate ligase, partial [Deltaproteobacteria bacterium]|nr:UDP-N-acetylmuramoyl-L-alanyl-D-glutamate--2,6-diaminopimelate ligase [Deltaproteobacteria bacterium]